MAKDLLSFKPKEVTKKLLTNLSERGRDVLSKRYGLDTNARRLTLEAIGGEYNITRERVRQIENFNIALTKKAEAFTKAETLFSELKKLMEQYGGIVHEQLFLEAVAKDKSTQNHVHFLLVLSDLFTKLKEDDDFNHRWTTDINLSQKIHKSLQNLCKSFKDTDLISEQDLIARFLVELKDVVKEPEATKLAHKWLAISKQVGKNPLGEWGLAKSPNVRMRGIRDYAFLVIRQHGSPMHFTEVAKAITKQFGRVAHPATCHNELIKDKRFVLVGRGLYALAEWGYSRGVVLDVIKSVLKKKGPLTKEQVVSEVLKERYVKENTIIVNLQNPKYFKKDKNNRYGVL